MDLIGSPIVAGVAAAAHNAQQVARAKDKREQERARATRRIQQAFEAHLRALEESEQDSLATRLHVDGDPPEQSPADARPVTARAAEHHDEPVAPTPPRDPGTPGPTDALYRHVDLTA